VPRLLALSMDVPNKAKHLDLPATMQFVGLDPQHTVLANQRLLASSRAMCSSGPQARAHLLSLHVQVLYVRQHLGLCDRHFTL
jgi:ABC-type antimicrobial peptide transport system ATPase subunit